MVHFWAPPAIITQRNTSDPGVPDNRSHILQVQIQGWLDFSAMSSTVCYRNPFCSTTDTKQEHKL